MTASLQPPRDGEPDLLPCPFCGEPAITDNVGENGKALMIECMAEHCGVHPHVSCYDRRAAREWWNTRLGLSHARPEPQARNEGKSSVPNVCGFTIDQFSYTAELMRNGHRSAAMSNNFNIILAALDYVTANLQRPEPKVEDADAKWCSSMNIAERIRALASNSPAPVTPEAPKEG